MAKNHYQCPVCKKKNLIYVDDEVFCSNCKTYNKKLNYYDKYVQWTFLSNGWYRVPLWLVSSMLGISLAVEYTGIINTILDFKPPVFGALSGIFSTLSLGMHELGHALFSVLGETMMRAGGSLMEIIFPSLLFLGLLQKKYYFAAALSLMLIGGGYLSWAVYVSDAVPQILTLVSAGGYLDDPSQIHDWYRLLNDNGHLQKYDELANLLKTIGYLHIVAGITISGVMIYQSIRNKVPDFEPVPTPNETPSQPQSKQ